MAEIREGDWGTILRVTIKENGSAVDVSSATVKNIILTPPGNGVEIVKAASFTTDGSDGKIQYTIEQGLTDGEPGIWHICARIEMPAGGWTTNFRTFGVADV